MGHRFTPHREEGRSRNIAGATVLKKTVGPRLEWGSDASSARSFSILRTSVTTSSTQRDFTIAAGLLGTSLYASRTRIRISPPGAPTPSREILQPTVGVRRTASLRAGRK